MTQKGCPPIPSLKGDKLEGADADGNKLTVTHDSLKQDISKIRVEGKDGAYTLECDWENQVKFRGINISNVSGKKLKPNVVTFKNGDKVIINQAD